MLEKVLRPLIHLQYLFSMIYKWLLLLGFCLTLSLGQCQVVDTSFDEEISSLLDFSVPTMTVDDLSDFADPILILDAREVEEYNVSHIPAAIHLGYSDPAYHKLDQIDKRQPIVLYCSVGYRSEKIGEQLLDMGFVHVYNLYGSIFEWANRGKDLENVDNNTTLKVHTYNKDWSQWINNPNIEKTW